MYFWLQHAEGYSAVCLLVVREEFLPLCRPRGPPRSLTNASIFYRSEGQHMSKMINEWISWEGLQGVSTNQQTRDIEPTLGQHWPNIGSMSRVCWENS